VSKKWKARLGVALLAVIAGMGCNPILFMGYLINGQEDPKMPAEFPLKPKPEKEKEPVKVVVLTSYPLQSGDPRGADMIGADKLLAIEFISLLQARCAENKENVVIKASQIVENFKRDHPEWSRMSPNEIGKKFDADYVIDIEIISISISDPKDRDLLRGRANISMACYDTSKPLDEPAYNPTELNFEYPKAYPVSRSDQPVSAFRKAFFKQMASQMVLRFSAHTSQQKVSID
jgi:hypothetical protein